MMQRLPKVARIASVTGFLAASASLGFKWWMSRPEYAAGRIATLLEQARWSELFDYGTPEDGFSSGLTREQFVRTGTSIMLNSGVKNFKFTHFEETGRTTFRNAWFNTNQPNVKLAIWLYWGPNGWCFEVSEFLWHLAKLRASNSREASKLVGQALIDSGFERMNTVRTHEFATRVDAERLAAGEVDFDHMWHRQSD